jgi:Caspase domain
MRKIFYKRVTIFLFFFQIFIFEQGFCQNFEAVSKPKSYNIASNGTSNIRKDYALLIANETYDDRAYNQLKNPILDVEVIGKLLKDNFNFETEILKNATRDECINIIKKYAQKAYGTNDQLFIYFAGHGDFDGILKQGYVVMKDSKQDNNFAQHLQFDNLQGILSKFNMNHILLTLDVCYGGTFDSYFALQEEAQFRGNELARGLPAANKSSQSAYLYEKLKPNTRLYLSSGGKETVSDGLAGAHSPFAKAFIEKLNEAAKSEYKYLTVNELKVYLERKNFKVKMGSFTANESNSDFIFVANDK